VSRVSWLRDSFATHYNKLRCLKAFDIDTGDSDNIRRKRGENLSAPRSKGSSSTADDGSI
jgi:hypothetical protein